MFRNFCQCFVCSSMVGVSPNFFKSYFSLPLLVLMFNYYCFKEYNECILLVPLRHYGGTKVYDCTHICLLIHWVFRRAYTSCFGAIFETWQFVDLSFIYLLCWVVMKVLSIVPFYLYVLLFISVLWFLHFVFMFCTYLCI